MLHRENHFQELIQRLLECKHGTANAAAFEKICTEIMRLLFPYEFPLFLIQHPTHDNRYRMDLVCSIQKTTPFWQYITEKFKSDFLVCEFKNYEKSLPQNVVHDCTKYLPSHGFRNIAFLISRKGFSRNARTRSMDLLREGKVILDLTDDDLVEMLRMKERGEDPSEYLMDKLQRMLLDFSG